MNNGGIIIFGGLSLLFMLAGIAFHWKDRKTWAQYQASKKLKESKL